MQKDTHRVVINKRAHDFSAYYVGNFALVVLNTWTYAISVVMELDWLNLNYPPFFNQWRASSQHYFLFMLRLQIASMHTFTKITSFVSQYNH